MTATESHSRQDRRPEWLQRKHSQQPTNAKLADWADRTAEELYGRWGQSVPLGPFRTETASATQLRAIIRKRKEEQAEAKAEEQRAEDALAKLEPQLLTARKQRELATARWAALTRQIGKLEEMLNVRAGR